jgi:hypothetical protein
VAPSGISPRYIIGCTVWPKKRYEEASPTNGQRSAFEAHTA